MDTVEGTNEAGQYKIGVLGLGGLGHMAVKLAKGRLETKSSPLALRIRKRNGSRTRRDWLSGAHSEDRVEKRRERWILF